jgi:hypothetical protein
MFMMAKQRPTFAVHIAGAPRVRDFMYFASTGSHAFQVRGIEFLLALEPSATVLAHFLVRAPSWLKPKLWEAFTVQPREPRVLAWLMNAAYAPYREQAALLLSEQYPGKRELLVAMARLADELYAAASPEDRAAHDTRIWA